ncbi:MAG: TetM/TetW/TetO/TetS family tetracycline resistance ribosomal protection protein [Bacteroidales bacterium]|nr:TetM/TetW/TetO/TetS family tetracycline resistance ribosomal protection protein [Bacteroidales bacterium]MBK9356033.1 TetM/TetW/TetO/TetS family tetracycline resistance ribosomal protection protein [Bacteroidales bacterium]
MTPPANPSLRNIAILAHADAGKTTITEQFLYLSGQTRQPGNVDKGTAQTDFLPVEKERGISVSSSHTSFHWGGVRINLIDTPGHVDFSADVERVLRIPDGVILVISAVEGVQAHTETLWHALRERRIPVVFFVNKTDRTGADTDSVVRAIEKELNIVPMPLQEVSGEGEPGVKLKSLWGAGNTDSLLMEKVVESDETLLNSYLEGNTPAFEALDSQLGFLIQSASVYPLLFGSAKMGLGIQALLDFVVKYFPVPKGETDKPLSALVYGIGHDKVMGKIAYVRVFNGSVATREVIFNATQGAEEKVTQVRRLFPGRYEDTGLVEAGDLAGLCGIGSACVGDLLGEPTDEIPEVVRLRTPLIIVRVKAMKEKDYPALAAAMLELSAEDPALEFDWLREESELQVKIMGWIQMEVLERILADRFGIEAKFENPTVIYKETPASAGEGFVQYWMPKPCWAIMKFRIEPGERGSGVSYRSLLGVNDVQQKYQNEVERTIGAALKQGIKGWEVTDIRITLIEGEDHPVHSRAGDFAVATPMGIMNGLVNTGTTLLEPMIRFKIDAPEELLGVITSDITQMRGNFDSPGISPGRFTLTGELPLSTSIDYPVKLSSRSGGKARIFTFFCGYRECTDEQGVIRPYRGISPLDTAKYILKARKALQ